jgi:NADPH-dependent 2,4-dienoyl-CoA reductase/sulfur reductase-like enzyme
MLLKRQGSGHFSFLQLSKQKMKPLNIVIVGAGIGGLEAALALAGDGHQVVVLDSVTEFGEVLISSSKHHGRH